MFGTPQEPGLIPKCLHRIFRNVGQNVDDKVLFKPDGLENLMPTGDSRLDTEVSVRNYIFKDDKTDSVSENNANSLGSMKTVVASSPSAEHCSTTKQFSRSLRSR